MSKSVEARPVIFGINTLAVRPGKGEVYFRELVSHLARIDTENEYRLFASLANRADFATHAANFRVITAPLARRGSWARIMAEQLWLPLAARQAGLHAMLCPSGSLPWLLSQPTVIAVQDLLPLPTGGGASAQPAGRSTLHPLRGCPGLRHRWERASLRRSIRRAAAVLVASEQTRRETACYGALDPARIIVARHGVSSEFRPLSEADSRAAALERYGLRAPYLLIVGGLSPYKNLDRALEALAQVRRWSHRLPMLALVGDDRLGCRSSLQRLVAALDLEEQVRFLGALPRMALPALYSAAAASLSLSPCEACGLPIIESMACGCPVICARRSSQPEVAGQAALFVDPDQPQEVAEAIWRLVTLTNVREAWSAKGIGRARQFDWHETARITRDVLLAAAEGRPVGAAADVKLEV